MKRRCLLRLCTFAAAGSVFAASSHAFGNDDYWEQGFGQGTIEAIVTRGPGNSIYVACEAGSGQPSSITFQLGGQSPSEDRVLLTFDNQDPINIWVTDGQIMSDCRACANNFDFVIERLKRHNSVHVMFQNGNAARFSLRGSSAAIGDCTAGFWQS